MNLGTDREICLLVENFVKSNSSVNNYILESFFQTPKGISAIKKAIITGAVSLSAFLASPIADKFDKKITDEIVKQVVQNSDIDYDIDGEPIELERIPNYVEKLEAISKIVASSINAVGVDVPPVNPEFILWYCFKYDFDIPLLCSQAHWESHFGADPNARRCQLTKSLFSVGLWDSGKNVCSYDSFEDSIPSYIKLMKRDYLENKSVDQLLTNKGFVNFDNKRYASNPNYEKNLRATRDKYIRLYPILAS